MRRIVGFLLMALILSVVVCSVAVSASASEAIKTKRVVVISNPEYIKGAVENEIRGVQGIKVYNAKRTPKSTKIDYVIEAEVMFARISVDRYNGMEKADVAVQIKVICASNGRIYDSAIVEANAFSPRWQNRNVNFEAIMEALNAAVGAINWNRLTN